MTRESDVFVPLELRARIANASSDSIFVSLHFNATDRDPIATGFEIYSLTPRGAPSTYEDALHLHRSIFRTAPRPMPPAWSFPVVFITRYWAKLANSIA